MTNKYCLIITASPYYVIGLNSILNAFRYYHHTDTDVVIMHPDSTKKYVALAQSKFEFPIIGERVHYWGDRTMRDPWGNWDENMNCIWAEYHYMLHIKDKYEAIAFMDADELLLANIMHYFQIAASTDLLLVPHNNRCGRWIIDFPCFDDPRHLARGFPLQQFMTFYNPKHHSDVIQYIWERRFNNENREQEDREPQEEVFLFNMAIHDLKKVDKVFELPGSLWLNEEHVPFRTGITTCGAGEFKVASALGDRVMGMHSRWWNKDIIRPHLKATIDIPEAHARVSREKQVGESIIDFFNRGPGALVTLEEIRKAGVEFVLPLDCYEKG